MLSLVVIVGMAVILFADQKLHAFDMETIRLPAHDADRRN